MRLEEPTPPAPAEALAVGQDGGKPLHPLAHLALLVSTEVGAVAVRNSLTPMQARMLNLLVQGPRRMVALAQDLGVEQPALTGLVDRAESRGLVARETVPGDRRSMNVVATDLGAAASATFCSQVTEVLDSLIAPLPSADRDSYSTWTQAIITARATRGEPSSHAC